MKAYKLTADNGEWCYTIEKYFFNREDAVKEANWIINNPDNKGNYMQYRIYIKEIEIK